jgi:dTMP kinase
MFFVFDGVDGSGKSTQVDLFRGWLESQGRDVLSCKDPGSTQLGEALRRLLLDRHQIQIATRTEMMLFTTARTQLVEELIRPALAANRTVVLDRYIFSTVVYQGSAGNLSEDEIWTVNRIATGGLLPDLTFIFDLSPEQAFRRVQARYTEGLDRMESRGIHFFAKVREGFLKEARRWADRVTVIDSDRPVDVIQKEIRAIAATYLNRADQGKIGI